MESTSTQQEQVSPSVLTKEEQVAPGVLTKEEQMGLQALAVELEEGKHTRSSISRELSWTSAKNGDHLDFASRLETAVNAGYARAVSQLGPWNTGCKFRPIVNTDSGGSALMPVW
jgi:hypothetical protein